MSIESEIKVGSVAIAKVGRNEIRVTISAVTENGWMVRNDSGREFAVRKLERIISQPVEFEPESSESRVAAETVAMEPAAAPCDKKLSLLEAAARILEQIETPLNCKEMIAKATEAGLWIPTAAKTPEQSLYSAIFREINGKENPRFKKSAERKGTFKFIR